MARSKGLGRGLSALLNEESFRVAQSNTAPEHTDAVPDAEKTPTQKLPIEKIIPNPKQPRKNFDPKHLEELAASIREKGILQPILVRPSPDTENAYQLIAGERRWRAAQQANCSEVPVIIRDFSDVEMMEVAVIENVQRENLNAIEEAEGYFLLVKEFSYTQAQLAKVVGKSRPNIANALRLLNLPENLQALLRDGQISAGHGRALLSAKDPEALAQRVIDENLNVRATEALVATENASQKPNKAPANSTPTKKKDVDTQVLESTLSSTLKVRVRIDPKNNQKGRISIAYDSLERLDEICSRLMHEANDFS